MRSSHRYFLPFYLIFYINFIFPNNVFAKKESLLSPSNESAHLKSSSIDLIDTEDLSSKKASKEKKKIFLLALDGGAIRGIIHAHVLAHLEKLLEAPITKIFSAVAGTSTGAIVALGIGIPNFKKPGRPLYTAEEIQNMYLTERGHIFKKQSIIKRLRAGDGAFKPKYAANTAEESFEKYYNNHQLSDLLIPTFIPVTEISEGNGATIMSSLKARKNLSRNYLVNDVARATSAAPGYFEAKEILEDATGADDQTLLNFWDGGMFANNPAEIVLMEAQKIFPYAQPKDFVLLSIGTGEQKIKISHKKSQKIGYINGGAEMVRTMLNAQKSWIDKKLKKTLGENYLRLQINLNEKGFKHDDISIEYLEALYFASEKMIADAQDKLNYLKNLWDIQKRKRKSTYEYFSELQILISKKYLIPLDNKPAIHALYQDYCTEHHLNPKKRKSIQTMIKHVKNRATIPNLTS